MPLSHVDPNISGYQILKTPPEMIFNDLKRYQWHVANQLAKALADEPNTLSTGRQALATIEAIHKIINPR